MRKKVIAYTVFGAVLSLLALSVDAGKQPSVDGDRVEFSLADLDGAIVESSEDQFTDRVLLITLWATWCPPCLTEIPTFIDLQERYGERGLTVVAIAFESVDDPTERREMLQEFASEQKINYLVLDGGPPAEFETALPMLKGVRGFPVEILVDRSGRVVEARNGYGYKKKWARKLNEELEALLGPGSSAEAP